MNCSSRLFPSLPPLLGLDVIVSKDVLEKHSAEIPELI